GNIYVAGTTPGTLGGANAGAADFFVRKYDAAGAAVWTSQFGTPAGDVAQGIAADVLGNVYVVGRTSGAFPDQTKTGFEDAFVAKLATSVYNVTTTADVVDPNDGV